MKKHTQSLLFAIALASGAQAAIINGVMLGEVRDGNAVIYNINNTDANGDNTPDDPNALLVTSTFLGNTTVTGNVGSYIGGQTWVTPTDPNQTDNMTARYSFELYDADGIFTFAENIDDQAYVTVNGNSVISDTGWNTTTTGTYTGSGAGWYAVEIRLVEFGGGAGPAGDNSNGATNWTNTFGLGIFNGTTTSLDRNTYSEISATNPAIDADPVSGARIRAVLIPEPTTMALGGLALLGLARRRRRA
jgi:hypothetical protein